MQGIGIYQYADGIVYEGEYHKDTKMGYGFYKWTDERIYEGYWFKGKQHGLGIYSDPKKGTRYGLWEHGKRLKWYDEETVELIQQHRYDVAQDMSTPAAAGFLEAEATFDRPDGIDEQLYNIKLTFKL